jgi:hypothetical protein
MRSMMKALLGVALAVGCAAAFAGGPGAVRRQVEASMRVTGSVDVDAQGAVTGFRLDAPEKLPPEVVALVHQRAPDWLFEPYTVQGVALASTASMSLRVAARRRQPEDKRFVLDIVGASFNVTRRDPAEFPAAASMAPPSFPNQAAQIGAQGTVFLLVKVGRDGKVADAIAEQVNLRFITDEGGMARLRRQFTAAATAGARRWTFQVPTAGDAIDKPFWTVRVPVAFHLDRATARAEYGQWESYVPGPRASAPWEADTRAGFAFAPDTLSDGGVYPVGGGLKLRAAPGG